MQKTTEKNGHKKGRSGCSGTVKLLIVFKQLRGHNCIPGQKRLGGTQNMLPV